MSILTPPGVELPPPLALTQETSLSAPRVSGSVAALLAMELLLPMEVFKVRVKLLCRDRIMGRMLQYCRTEERLRMLKMLRARPGNDPPSSACGN